MFEGHGIEYNTDGSIYDGQWSNGELNGQGSYTKPNVGQYRGNFVDG